MPEGVLREMTKKEKKELRIQVLKKALELVKQNWTNDPDKLSFPNGPWCAGTALQVAYWGSKNYPVAKVLEEPYYESIYNIVREVGGFKSGCIASWNDSHTKEEVVATFEKAIEIAEK